MSTPETTKPKMDFCGWIADSVRRHRKDAAEAEAQAALLETIQRQVERDGSWVRVRQVKLVVGQTYLIRNTEDVTRTAVETWHAPGWRTVEGNAPYRGDREVWVVSPWPKQFKVNPPIGKCRHSISTQDGVTTHKDGSPFWGIDTFKSKKLKEAAVKKLRAEGWHEC